MLESSAKRYLAFLSMVTLSLVVGVFSINCLVDPLFYLRGNLITDKNFGFNERLSKVNYFFRNPDQYDCFIFGSSRAILLDQNKVKGYNCMNFSWALGAIDEFISYASYLKGRGYIPKLVIVGVAGFNFQRTNESARIPDFIADNSSPPGFLMRYLTLDALEFSIRTLQGSSPWHRFYRSDLSVGILCGAPPYDPKKFGGIPELQDPNKFNPKRVAQYKELMEIFPDSEFVFYVAPLSVWVIRALEEDGRLDGYLRSIYELSRVVPVLYDFSIPSNITADPRRTYDGDHYDNDVNELIVETINSGTPQFGIDVTDMTYDSYQDQYLNALKNQLAPVDSGPINGSQVGACIS